MIQALMSGVASIQAQQTAMDVIGNNLANISTTGFKGQQVTFSDLIDQQLRGAMAPSSGMGGEDPLQFGLGVQVGSTATDMSQGSLSATANPSNMAIQGNGFFMVSNGSQISYTRDGSFSLDANGDLVNTDNGQELIGYTADSAGKIDTSKPIGTSDTLKIPIGQMNSAQATTQMSVTGNLNSSASSTDTGTVTETVYDSNGNSHDITIQFSNPQTPPPTSPTPPAGATSAWTWTAYSGDSATGTPIGSSTTSGNSLAYFNASGANVSSLATGALNTITVPATGSGSATTVGIDISGMSELGSATALTAGGQNGFPPGTLQGFEVSQSGLITGTFSNGQSKTLGQVALAGFTNPEGLASEGSNLYVATPNSGSPTVGAPGSAGLGSVNSGFLEQSNVDLSTNLTNLIVTQRGFEANTKIVSTVDDMLETVIQMKH